MRLTLVRRSIAVAFACLFVACASRPKVEAAPSVAPSSAALEAQPTEPVHLVVLHTNDIHGQVLERKATWIDRQNPPSIGGLERLAAEVSAQRRRAEDEGALVIVVDGGDWYQGTPEGVIDHGRPFVEALALVGYDALSLGNHEFDHGIANLRRILDAARLPALASNVREKGGERIDWVEPWRIVERSGLSIALVGFLTPATPYITHKDASTLEFADVAAEYGRAANELAGKVDWILPVGHIGVDEATELATAHPEIPLIVSGHSHTYLPEGQLVGETLIVQTGSKASALGRVDVWFDPSTKRVLSSHAEVIDLLGDNEPFDRDPELARRCAELVDLAKADMATVVGELTAPVERAKGFRSSTAGNWTTDLMRELTGADVAIHNKGGIRSDIQAGPVTRRDLFEIAPFDNTVVSFELSGANLESVVRHSTEGSTHSGMEYSGLVVRAGSDAEGKLTVVAIEIGGKPLDPAARYRVATNSFLAAGGDGIDEFKHATERREEPMLVRDLCEWGLANHGPVTPPNDARCVLVP
jgi:5'-nucleotidase / UDP-sugar diphosphatase